MMKHVWRLRVRLGSWLSIVVLVIGLGALPSPAQSAPVQLHGTSAAPSGVTAPTSSFLTHLWDLLVVTWGGDRGSAGSAGIHKAAPGTTPTDGTTTDTTPTGSSDGTSFGGGSGGGTGASLDPYG